ncbi:UNVERIFIED_CONTAM: hypothetical protein GTU68_001130 [Idotea baltica]|nr:hypothetical protein [Idotea baltica]
MSLLHVRVSFLQCIAWFLPVVVSSLITYLSRLLQRTLLLF